MFINSNGIQQRKRIELLSKIINHKNIKLNNSLFDFYFIYIKF